jgi:hypothetical protein
MVGIKLKKKQINKKPKITCGYCTYFWKAKERNVKETTRLCKILKKYISVSSTACGNIELYRFIFCNKNGQMRHSIVCLHNQNKGTSGCQKCRQGRHVKYLLQNGTYKGE